MSGRCFSGNEEGVCLALEVRSTLQEGIYTWMRYEWYELCVLFLGIFGSGGESRERANVGEGAAGSVPEERRRRKMKWPRQTAIWLRICSLGILQSF